MAKILEINGSPIKINGQDVYEAVYSGVVKQVDVAARKMTMIGTDETVDRDGDIIEIKGWQLENYRKNPVFLWAHNYGSVPLARAEKVIRRKDPVRLEFHLLYPTKGLHPFADMILELYGEYIINASSVGFIPEKWEDIVQEGERQEGVRMVWGRRFVKQELLELSGCAVPSNPNALQNALKSKSFLDMPFEDVQKWLQGQTQPPRPKNVDDIMGELDLKADYIDETKSPMIQVPKNICSIEEDEEPSFTKEEEIDKELVEKPYPNEHACRLEDPGKYDRFARKNCYRKHDDKCIDFIFGIKEGKSETQSMRYDKKVWTATAAKSHCGAHDGTFEAAKEAEEVEGKNPVMEKVDLLALKLEDLDKYIRSTINEVLEIIKSKVSTRVDLALPNDQNSMVEGDGKSVSETILGEAFEQRSRVVSLPASIPAQYDFKGVIAELKNLQQSLKSLKGE